MITAGKNPFELSATSGHLGTAASALRDAIDDLRLLGVNLNVLGMLVDAQKLCSNLAQQIDKAAETELMRVNNTVEDDSAEAILRDLGVSAKNPSSICPTCSGLGTVPKIARDPDCTEVARCHTCHGGGVA